MFTKKIIKYAGISLFLFIYIFCANNVFAAEFNSPTIKDNSYQAKFVSQSAVDPINIEAGKTKDVEIIFKNTGTAVWYGTGKNYVSVYTVDPNYRVSKFFGSVWVSKNNPSKISGIVKPSQIGKIKIKLYAPDIVGEYTEKFYLAAEGKTWIKGSYFYLKIKVTASKEPVTPVAIEVATSTLETTGSVIEATASDDVASTTLSPRTMINQPNIRVGLYKTDKPVEFVASYPYEVYSGKEHQGTLFVDAAASISYESGKYVFQSDYLNFTSADPIRLVPDDMNYFFELKNYERKISGRNKNFNMYRGVLEYRYSPKSEMPYVISELPLDEYVAGIAETSNDSSMEYIKALLVAARSYAFTLIDPKGPTDKRLFDVYPNTTDQLYLGYNSEVLMPRVVQAAHDTYGEMVTYKRNPVTTYYFGHSDGRTRNWIEVWGGSGKPWLQSVKAKYDTGLKMWGHGIGMSTHDASQRAVMDKWTYDQILKYYYTGTEVEKIY